MVSRTGEKESVLWPREGIFYIRLETRFSQGLSKASVGCSFRERFSVFQSHFLGLRKTNLTKEESF